MQYIHSFPVFKSTVVFYMLPQSVRPGVKNRSRAKCVSSIYLKMVPFKPRHLGRPSFGGCPGCQPFFLSKKIFEIQMKQPLTTPEIKHINKHTHHLVSLIVMVSKTAQPLIKLFISIKASTKQICSPTVVVFNSSF